MKSLFLNLINFYRRFVSPFTKRSCIFYPTCSEYMKEAVQKHGIFTGIRIGLARILRCHPWGKGGVDLLK
jgi:putative membrane protein insertion efficiency factor